MDAAGDALHALAKDCVVREPESWQLPPAELPVKTGKTDFSEGTSPGDAAPSMVSCFELAEKGSLPVESLPGARGTTPVSPWKSLKASSKLESSSKIGPFLLAQLLTGSFAELVDEKSKLVASEMLLRKGQDAGSAAAPAASQLEFPACMAPGPETAEVRDARSGKLRSSLQPHYARTKASNLRVATSSLKEP